MEAAFGAVGVAIALVCVIGGLRLLRTAKVMRTRVSRCDGCGGSQPVIQATFHQNTGMLIMRRHHSFEGSVCRSCALRVGGKMTLHTIVLGPWGFISFFASILFVLNNAVQLIAALSLPATASLAKDALGEHREYALNLLATKDRATVVEVLVRTTGATPAVVERYLDGLSPPAS